MKITLDWDGEDLDAGPEVGDVLRSARKAYLVQASRRVRSRVHPSRWALRVKAIDTVHLTATVRATGRRVITFRWHPRGRRRG